MENQNGRSMIEMLGVLAIVGILSVGGIAGYSKAMTQYKLNKLVEEYSLLFQQLQPYIKSLCMANTTGAYTSIDAILNRLEIIPDAWSVKYIQEDKVEIKDSFGRKVAWFTRNKKYLAADYYMQNSGKDMATKEDILLCQKMWIDIIKPHADILNHVSMSRGGMPLLSYGNNYCNKTDKPCIADRTISEIIKTCSSCGESVCVLAIDFTW